MLLLAQTSAIGRRDLQVAVMRRVEAKGGIKEAVKVKGRDVLSPLLRVLLHEKVFLPVSVVTLARMVLGAVSYDTTLRNAVSRITKQSHAVNIIPEQR